MRPSTIRNAALTVNNLSVAPPDFFSASWLAQRLLELFQPIYGI